LAIKLVCSCIGIESAYASHYPSVSFFLSPLKTSWKNSAGDNTVAALGHHSHRREQ